MSPETRGCRHAVYVGDPCGAQGRWRKMKGTATVRLAKGALRVVELHWYEAHGIGQRDVKIKRYLDES